MNGTKEEVLVEIRVPSDRLWALAMAHITHAGGSIDAALQWAAEQIAAFAKAAGPEERRRWTHESGERSRENERLGHHHAVTTVTFELSCAHAEPAWAVRVTHTEELLP